MKKSLTVLEKERESKNIVGETLEILDKTGQESEKASVPFVKEVQKKQDEIENKATNDILNKLDMKKRAPLAYEEALRQEFIRSMLSYDLPTGWKWTVGKTEKGIVVYLRSPQGKMYARAMTPCGTPVFDINCMDRMLIKALQFMEKNDSKTRTESGIYLK